ncbi:MAG TPA: hypothetical protein VMS74_03080, partial [Acidimicrobiia bacterium]|nr:hypothetical protein [Acidimicrobiia bacterium]
HRHEVGRAEGRVDDVVNRQLVHVLRRPDAGPARERTVELGLGELVRLMGPDHRPCRGVKMVPSGRPVSTV